MIFLDGREFTGKPPGLRTVQRGPLMLAYLTDVRGERVVIIQGELDRLTQAATEAPRQRRWHQVKRGELRERRLVSIPAAVRRSGRR